MAPLSDFQKLSLLSHCGLKVDEDGCVSDWLDRPPHQAKPAGQIDDNHIATRRRFTAREDEMLKKWCMAAEREGIKGNRVFEQFETVCPNHPWQAYRTRWLKTLKSTTTSDVGFDDPYPQLDCVTTNDPSTEDHGLGDSLDIFGQESEELEDVSYNDSRIDRDRVVFKKLGVEDEDGLRKFLRSPWVVKVFEEFRKGTEADDISLRCITTQTSDHVNRSRHEWKLQQATCVLNLSGNASRYGSDHPDMASWTEDDHDIHFIVRAVQFGCTTGQMWQKDNQLRGWAGPCESALWLLLWFKWICKNTSGRSSWSERIQKKREMWLAFMNDMVAASYHHHRETLISDLSDETRTPTHPSESSTQMECSAQNGRLTLSKPRPRPDVKLKVDQQFLLISAQTRDLYLRNRDSRLSSWGVSTNHGGTCVLVPAMWATTEPVSLIDHPEAWPLDEPQTPRLCLPMGAFHFPWARAAAWFEQWPRSTEELQHFLPPNDCRQTSSHMHGSHLCHHGLCINATHIVYEEQKANLSRKSCVNAAVVLRSYQAAIPKHCSKHEPPCLLQAAALTTFEVFAIQFNILRIAKDLDGRVPYQQPTNHPHAYQTFEQGPMPSAAFPDVGIHAATIVRLPQQTNSDTQRGFRWNCALCAYTRTFQQITSFWAHAKADHRDSGEANVLQEVTRSAQAYQTWAYERFYDYRRQNPVTWQKLIQAQADDFTWEVFANWRLPRERHYQGRTGVQPGSEA